MPLWDYLFVPLGHGLSTRTACRAQFSFVFPVCRSYNQPTNLLYNISRRLHCWCYCWFVLFGRGIMSTVISIEFQIKWCCRSVVFLPREALSWPVLAYISPFFSLLILRIQLAVSKKDYYLYYVIHFFTRDYLTSVGTYRPLNEAINRRRNLRKRKIEWRRQQDYFFTYVTLHEQLLFLSNVYSCYSMLCWKI